MVTAAQVTTYLNSIYLAQSLHMDKLARKEKTGKAEIFDDKVIAAVLNS
jgi:hypothetical protein